MREQMLTRRATLKGIGGSMVLSALPTSITGGEESAEDDEESPVVERSEASPPPGVGAIAVGTGDTSPMVHDTDLEEEIYRVAPADHGFVSRRVRGSADADFDEYTEVGVFVTSGIEIPIGDTLSELGVFGPDGDLLIHTRFSPVPTMAGQQIQLCQALPKEFDSMSARVD